MCNQSLLKFCQLASTEPEISAQENKTKKRSIKLSIGRLFVIPVPNLKFNTPKVYIWPKTKRRWSSVSIVINVELPYVDNLELWECCLVALSLFYIAGLGGKIQVFNDFSSDHTNEWLLRTQHCDTLALPLHQEGNLIVHLALFLQPRVEQSGCELLRIISPFRVNWITFNIVSLCFACVCVPFLPGIVSCHVVT